MYEGGDKESNFPFFTSSNEEDETWTQEEEPKETTPKKKEEEPVELTAEKPAEEAKTAGTVTIRSRMRFEQPILLLIDGEEKQIRLDPFSEYGPVSEDALTPQVQSLQENGRIEIKSTT